MEEKYMEKLDEHVVEIIRFHFSEETGSKFWLDKAKMLPFNPLTDIKSFNDLERFEDYSDELRDIPIEDLIPKGLCHEDIFVYESGGATGKPKRIIEHDTRLKGVHWLNQILDANGFPGRDEVSSWLFLGPSGPHIVGKSMGNLARLRGARCFYVDFDPRWVRKCIKNKKEEQAEEYINHIISQAKDIIRDQNIGVLFVTPSVLERLISDKELLSIMRTKIKGIIWSGTSFSNEGIKFLQEEIFCDVSIMGIYGNSLMGIAPQVPHHQTKYASVFHSFYPYSIAEVVHVHDCNKPVDYYEKGQVKVTLLTKEMFMPNNLERDEAVRIPPSTLVEQVLPLDCVAAVKPITNKDNAIIEGVY